MVKIKLLFPESEYPKFVECVNKNKVDEGSVYMAYLNKQKTLNNYKL